MSVIDVNTIVARAEHVFWHCIDDEAILLNIHSGMYYTLNTVGCDIWKTLDGKRDVRELGEELCQHYTIDPQQAKQDLLALFDELRQEDLVVTL